MSEVHGAASTLVTDPGLRTQAARAEVARLSLAVRAGRQDAEQAEREAANLDRLARDAEDFLKASLDELFETRRRACEQDLAEERALAEAVVAQAREEAAQAANLAVGAAAASEGGDDERPAAPNEALGIRLLGGGELPDAADHPTLSTDEPVASGEPEGAPAIESGAGAAALDPRLGSDVALIPADELRELVRASVVLGLREAMEQAAAMMRLTPAPARPAALEVQSARDRMVDEAVDEQPFRRRFLHLDVLLPLVAALIVLILFVAWIG